MVGRAYGMACGQRVSARLARLVLALACAYAGGVWGVAGVAAPGGALVPGGKGAGCSVDQICQASAAGGGGGRCAVLKGADAMCQPGYMHCVPAREPAKAARYANRPRFHWLDDGRMAFHWQDSVNGGSPRVKTYEEAVGLLKKLPGNQTRARVYYDQAVHAAGLTVVLYGAATPPDGDEAWPHSAHVPRGGGGDEMELCFNARELFARALAAPKPLQAANLSVVMADNRQLGPEKTGEYWSVASTLNALYALTHGYAFVREEEIRLADPELRALNWKARGAPWIKVAVGSALLHQQDFVLMLDSDAFVYQLELGAEANLKKWGMLGAAPEKLMAVSHEENPKLWPTGGRFNTGVWFMRNAPQSYAMLKAWATQVEKGRDGRAHKGGAKGAKGCDPKYLTEWSFDQKPFEACVFNNRQFHKLIQALPQSKPLNMPHGEWIKHYPNWSYFLKFRQYSLQHAFIVGVYRLERYLWCTDKASEGACHIPYAA